MPTKKNTNVQVFTPPNITQQMLDIMDVDWILNEDTYVFEPTVGCGDILIVVLNHMYSTLVKYYEENNIETTRACSMALANCMFKFFAVELDKFLATLARIRVVNWAKRVARRDCDTELLCLFMFARAATYSIEVSDFFDVMERFDTSVKTKKTTRGVI